MENHVTKKINWDHISKGVELLNGLASLVIIIGIIGLYFQVKEFVNEEFNRSAQLIALYDSQLFMGSNPQIRYAIEDCKPVLISSGGRFTEDQLGDYLNVFESLSISSDKRLIKKDMLYDDLSYEIDTAYSNPDVQKYLKENSEFYDGFRKLAEQSPYLKDDQNNCATSTTKISYVMKLLPEAVVRNPVFGEIVGPDFLGAFAGTYLFTAVKKAFGSLTPLT